MLEHSPLRNLHEEYAAMLRAAQQLAPGGAQHEGQFVAGIDYLPYGPSISPGGEENPPAIEIVATFGPVEAEYAAIRRGAGILERPQRGVIRVRGADRRDFLNRLLTQELKDLVPHAVKRGFWLNRKGRIETDLLIVERNDETLLDLDCHQLESTINSLAGFLFTEDVQLSHARELGRIAVHGRRAAEAVSAAAGLSQPLLLGPGEAIDISFGRADVTIARNDEAGEVGLELFIPRDTLPELWQALTGVDSMLADGKRRIRPIGWHAYNIARIEAGTPLFNVDFGPTNVPHETGLVHERVSFTKGCYLGQEIVARMQHLGKPKQILVGLRIESDRLPVAGAQVFACSDGSPGDQVGIVTSSTISPMLSAAPIAFAMVRSKHAESGSTIIVNAEGEQVKAAIHSLRFWPQEVPSP